MKKEKLEGKYLRLFEGDTEFLDEHFPKVGHTVVIRSLVRKFRRTIEEKLNKEGVPYDGRNLTITLDGSPEGLTGGAVSERPAELDD